MAKKGLRNLFIEKEWACVSVCVCVIVHFWGKKGSRSKFISEMFRRGKGGGQR